MRLTLSLTASLLAVGLTVASALVGPLDEYFSPADADAYVEAAVRALGDAESSIADKDYAVRLLGALGSASVASGYKSSACAAVVAALANGDLERIHHGINLGAGVGGCSNAKTDQVINKVAEVLEVRERYLEGCSQSGADSIVAHKIVTSREVNACCLVNSCLG